jgi:hypothetical protein
MDGVCCPFSVAAARAHPVPKWKHCKQYLLIVRLPLAAPGFCRSPPENSDNRLDNAVRQRKTAMNSQTTPSAAGKRRGTTKEPRSLTENGEKRLENVIRCRKTAFAVGKRRSPAENAVRQRKMPFAAGKCRSPPENAVRRRKMPFAAGKRHFLAENGDGRENNPV